LLAWLTITEPAKLGSNRLSMRASSSTREPAPPKAKLRLQRRPAATAPAPPLRPLTTVLPEPRACRPQTPQKASVQTTSAQPLARCVPALRLPAGTVSLGEVLVQGRPSQTSNGSRSVAARRVRQALLIGQPPAGSSPRRKLLPTF